jgi:acyl-CoA oxidase
MTYSPGILAVLPLFYIGWSDSVLSPSELKSIEQQIQVMSFLEESERKQLLAWIKQKPDDTTFKNWLEALRSSAKDINSSKLSLVELGIQMAKNADRVKDNGIWSNENVRQSIQELETALGVSHQFSENTFYRSVLPHAGHETESETAFFDSEKLQNILDGPYADIKTETKKFISDSFFEISYDVRNKEELREIVLEHCKVMARQGYGPYAYPKEYGGSGSPGGNTAIFETMALGNMSLLVKFGVQFGLFGGAILQLGTTEHHKKYLPKTGTLEIAGCFAMTETGHGSNVRNLETTAVFDQLKKTILVHSPTFSAGKEYIGNAMHSTLAVVFAQLNVNDVNQGIHAIVVPLRNEKHELLPGIKITDCGYKVGLNGVDNGRIWFENVEVPVENLLNKYGGINAAGQYESSIEKESKRFFTMLGALVGGRVSVSLASNMGAKKSLAIAIKYALKRRQFANLSETEETLILDYPTQQWRLFPLLAKSYALTFALETLRKKFVDNYGSSDQREVETLAAGLKSYASWHATATIQECREACGGKGYLAENEFADLKADTEIFTTFEGDNHVLLQLVSKALLTDLKQEFNDGGFMAVARHILGRVSTSVSTLNPVTIRNTDAEHLQSTEFLQSAFEYRRQKLLFSLSDRMRAYLSKKINGNEIFLKVQTHMVKLALAYVEEFVFNEFVAKINSLADGTEKEALHLMLRIYGLNAIYEDRGWFLENEFMVPDKSKAIRKVLDNLMRQIRPQAGLLVDAFGIPDVLLRAEIARL